ncbi:MFS transporter [Ligilactobacillus sp. LYQ139]|uniref:MFS transporter n=1 Tax=Ligilactobacillus sp. LYQ139 TaxID=3378800 RepID=UPI0038533E78
MHNEDVIKPSPPQQPRKASWLILISIGLGVLMAMLDVTIVNVALPTIQKEFHANFISTQWIVNAYTATYAISILMISKLGDLHGKKRFFLLSMAVFTLGSFMCAVAPNSLFLNVSRGIEGIGGAGILGLSMALVGDNYGGKQRTFILGIWGSIVGFGTSVGPLVGGVFVQYFNWRAIFLINIPVGLIAMYLGIRHITEKFHTQDRHLDFLGMILSTLTVACIVIGLLNKENDLSKSWFTFQITGWLVAGGVLLGIFILWELHVTYPMMNLALFKERTFVGSCVAAATISFGLFAFYTYMTILMQDYMGYSPLAVGCQRLLISAFPLILGAFVGYLVGRIGNRLIACAALFLEGIGFFLMHIMLGYHLTWTILIPAFIFMGLGNAGINPAISNAALENIAPQNMGMASGINSVFRQLGNCFGIVVQGLILSAGYQNSIMNGLHHSALAWHIVNAGPFAGMALAKHLSRMPNILLLIQHAYYDGIHRLLCVITVIFILSTVGCWFLLKRNPANDLPLDQQ